MVFPLCGGNIDSTVLGRVIERGLAADGRLIRFKVTVMDRPGGIAELSRLLGSLGVRYVRFAFIYTSTEVMYCVIGEADFNLLQL